MAIPYRAVIAGSLAVALASSSFAADLSRASAPAAVPTTTVLVRVNKLTGVSAANRPQVLYASKRGILMPLNDLANFGRHLDASGLVPDGAYHGLKIELANELHVYSSGHKPLHSQINPDGGPTLLPMLGTVVFAKGKVQPLALAIDPDRSMDDHKPYMVAERERADDPTHGKRENREDDEDDEDEDD